MQDLASSRFDDVYLTNARFHNCDLTGAVITGALLVNVDMSGEVENLRVNGVDVGPLVEAELNRRYPDRAKMRPADADGFRAGWDILERLWPQTVERARGMDPPLLHERVKGEWSFIQTLRHLVDATDIWVRRVMLGEPARPGTPWVCHTTTCATRRPSRATATYSRPWTRCSHFVRTGWPSYAG